VQVRKINAREGEKNLPALIVCFSSYIHVVWMNQACMSQTKTGRVGK